MPIVSPYNDNTNTPAQTSSVGFKVSKPGYDAHTSSGSNMVFDSSWPSLPIAFEITVSNTITGTGTTMIVPHNLQFPAFTMVWAYGPDGSGIGNVGTRFIPMVDKTNVYLNGNTISSPPFTATTLKIRCFQLDLSIDTNYILAPGDTFKTPYDPNFGIKVVKAGKDINSKDLRDFALHSRAQSPLILAVKTEKTIVSANLATAIGNVIQYTSVLNYPVWVYGFVKVGAVLAASLLVPENSYIPAPYYSQAYPKTTTDGFVAYLGYTSGANPDNGATLVILRDPMFAATQITVQY